MRHRHAYKTTRHIGLPRHSPSPKIVSVRCASALLQEWQTSHNLSMVFASQLTRFQKCVKKRASKRLKIDSKISARRHRLSEMLCAVVPLSAYMNGVSLREGQDLPQRRSRPEMSVSNSSDMYGILQFRPFIIEPYPFFWF